ncbi:lactate racemase domain-containing protein, partial [Singulisphaera rosea]
MKVAVQFQEEQLEVEIPEDRLVGEWHGPPRSPASEVERLVIDALENPRDYPALRQAVVPGDQVVIAFDAETPDAAAVLDATSRILLDSGVEASGITVLVSSGARCDTAPAIPAGATLAIHDPDDRAGLAYLATTKGERRVYLNRLATDADFVLPIGRLAYDRILGYRGPWSTLFPGLSDLPAMRSLTKLASDSPPLRDRPSAALTEASEVSWLLGSQFHIGVVAGTSGPCEVVAGLESSVRDQGMAAV